VTAPDPERASPAVPDAKAATARGRALVLRAALAYFAAVFGTGFVLGAIRVPFLVPRLGVRTAELLEMPVMAVAIVLAARWVARRYALGSSAGLRLAVGLVALALLVAAELALTLALQPGSLAEYVAGRDPVSGSVYLSLLAVYAAMPWMLRRQAVP
jgi:hypothetical protein